MQLKKLLLLESLTILMILTTAILAFQLIPSLQSSKQNSVPIYNQVAYPQHTLTMEGGSSTRTTFNYSTYDPAIIKIDLTVSDCIKPGYLNIYCNYRLASSLLLTPENKSVTLTLFSTSGFDWVEKPSAMAGINELLFESDPQTGYAGTLTYKITLRGSR